MPHKDPEANRIFQREWARKQREAKRLAKEAADPRTPLERDGEQLITKWVRRGDYLLRKMIASAEWYQEHKEEISEAGKERYENNREAIFAKNKRWADAHREELQRYHKQYYQDHKERFQQQSAEYYQRNREAIQEKTHIYYLANLVMCRIKQQEYHQRNREMRLAKMRGYYLAHTEELHAYEVQRYQQRREEVLARAREWMRLHPAEVAGYRHKRQARMVANGRIDLTTAQWKEIQKAHKYLCAYCGKKPKKLTMDHITPVTKGGGAYSVKHYSGL